MSSIDHRERVGDPAYWDVQGASQFNLLTLLGLRSHHHVLDIGCGSLRAGRLLIPFLEPGRYVGLEPDRGLVERGIERELGLEIVRLRDALFLHNDRFDAREAGRRFDFVLAHSIFSHASLRQIEACLAGVAAVLAERGVFLASFVEGEQDYAGDDWVYPDRTQFTLETLSKASARAGLTCTPLDWPHTTGQRWLYISPVAPNPQRLAAPDAAHWVAMERERETTLRRLRELKQDPGVRLVMRLRRVLNRIR